jgi:CheY-like chemotaxis protein
VLLEDMLGELGYTVAAEAAGIEEALEATKNADFDLAILDADLKGQPALARLPKPSLPAARRSFLPRAMARCPSPIGAGRS